MFVIIKLISMLLMPTTLMIGCVLVGLLTRSRPLAVFGALLLAACLVLPLGTWVTLPLEARFPAVSDPPIKVDGIVLLGGAIDDITSQDWQTPVLNGAANAVTSFVSLARRYPDAKLVFTGGSGSIAQGYTTETEWTRRLFAELGLSSSRVLFEDASRTTWENAVDVSRLVQPKPGETWVLLTNAMHMPRSVGVFRATGWSVLPWPTGYRSRPGASKWLPLMSENLPLLDMAAHEWLGMLAYWLLGHSSALFPAPS
ncbi:MAG: YdcF family protein [Janthinobacterium lividum]